MTRWRRKQYVIIHVATPAKPTENGMFLIDCLFRQSHKLTNRRRAASIHLRNRMIDLWQLRLLLPLESPGAWLTTDNDQMHMVLLMASGSAESSQMQEDSKTIFWLLQGWLHNQNEEENDWTWRLGRKWWNASDQQLLCTHVQQGWLQWTKEAAQQPCQAGRMDFITTFSLLRTMN